jgi:hypothetical protein
MYPLKETQKPRAMDTKILRIGKNSQNVKVTAHFDLGMRLIMYRTLPALPQHGACAGQLYLSTLAAIHTSIGCHVTYGIYQMTASIFRVELSEIGKGT